VAAKSKGVGPSKIFAAPEGSFPATDWSKLTLNGLPIPETLWGAVTYEMTDQGAAERNAKARAANGEGWPKIELGKARDDKDVDRYGDELADDRGDALDPMAQAMAGHVPAGHRGRWFGPRKTHLEGMIRAGIKYEPVLDDERRKVEIGGMFLGTAPTPVVERMLRREAADARDRIGAAEDAVREQNERIMTESGLTRVARRHRELDGITGVTEEDGAAVTEEILAGLGN
jgi:hypothetical protein